MEELIKAIEAGAPGNSFLASLHSQVMRGRTLSGKQVAAAERILAADAAAAKSVHVGEVGSRVEMVLTVERAIPLEYRGPVRYSRWGGGAQPLWGQSYMNLCRDENGNRVVYSGSSKAFPRAGETAKVIGTVSKHGEYRGEKNTYISRPAVISSPVSAVAVAEPELVAA